MTHTPETILAAFGVEELRRLALDMGFPPELGDELRTHLGEFAETDCHAAFVAESINVLDAHDVPLTEYVRARWSLSLAEPGP